MMKRELALREKEEDMARISTELHEAMRERDESHSLLEIRKLELADAQAVVGKDSLEEVEVLKLPVSMCGSKAIFIEVA